MVRHRGGRKRAMGTRAPMLIPMAPNDRWSLDFVSDQMTDGRRFRVLTVADDCTHECLTLVADTSLSGMRVARELETLMAQPRATQDDRQRQRPMSGSDWAFWPAGLDAGVCTRMVLMVNPGGLHRHGRALCHSKHRVHVISVALTVLKTRCRSRWKPQALSKGSHFAPSRLRGDEFSHLVPVLRKRDGSLNRC
jgi:putative transposase